MPIKEHEQPTMDKFKYRPETVKASGAQIAALSEKIIDENLVADRIELSLIINSYLDDGDDSVFEEIFHHIKTVPAGSLVETFIQSISESVVMAGDKGRQYTASLFAVPVVMQLERNQDIPASIVDKDSIVEIFNQSGLVADESTLILHHELLKEDVLSVPPSQIRKILIALLHSANNKTKTSIAITSDTKVSTWRPVALRFLLGVYISPADENPLIFTGSNDKNEDHVAALLEWITRSSVELKKQTGITSVVSAPGHLGSSICFGLTSFYGANLQYVIDRSIEFYPHGQQNCIAVISSHADIYEQEDAICIGLFDENNFRLAVNVWPTRYSNGNQHVMGLVTELLYNSSISQIYRYLPESPLHRDSENIAITPPPPITLDEFKDFNKIKSELVEVLS